MSQTKWILFATAVLIGIIGLIAYLLVKKRIKKMRSEYSEELDRAEDIVNKINNNDLDIKISIHKDVDGLENATSRETLGELLWEFDAELINKKIQHLPFVDMEFLISTIFRNKYESFLQVNSACGYELITVGTKGDMSLYYKKIKDINSFHEYAKKYGVNSKNIKLFDPQKKYDLILLPGFDKDIIGDVVDNYKLLNDNGLIFIPGMLNRKSKKYAKDLKKYLHLVNYRFEENQVCKNIMLIAK